MVDLGRSSITMICYCIAVIVMVMAPISAFEEESVSINKPVLRHQQPPWVQYSSDYVRCFCNLPTCVTTGYMCKSSKGVCFSDIKDQTVVKSTVYRGKHGCLELLSDKPQIAWCEQDANLHKKHPKSLMVCCNRDMCNHIDNPLSKNLLNKTLTGEMPEDPYGSKFQGNQQPFLYSNSEVWFRAATIAVPICGAVILFVLIALAIKILRSEHQNSPNHKLGPAMYVQHMPASSKNHVEKYPDHFDKTYDNLLRKEFFPPHAQNSYYVNQEDLQRQIHVPLLVSGECPHNIDKNDTNAKLNLMQCASNLDYLDSEKSIILEIGKEADANLVKNINSSFKYSAGDKFFSDKSNLSQLDK